MRNSLLRLLAGGAILAGVGLLVVADPATSYTTLGGSLGLNQRDMRLYDNFTQSRLHNNNTADANWPGYTQVELACWKGGAEWGSRAFGTGGGDPTQGVVGSGGANFDFFWSGNAGGIGNTNSNINSMIPGSNGGVLAFTETPISDGWRIRYYENWNWFDGPGSESGIDFQGVACHELGHALGLGHSSASGATMLPSISGNGTAQRSINGDDQNGVQAVYGSAGVNKPSITSVTGSFTVGGTVVLTGTNFSTSNNEVWLNDSGTGANPVKVTGLSSTAGGTQISFTVPSGVELAGAIHVKKNTTGGAALSEGHPFGDGPPPPTHDFFTLSGPTAVLAGVSVTYDISLAPPSSPYWLYVSKRLDGSLVINGQQFDIGPIAKTLDTGTTSTTGTASWTSTPVASRFAGRTFHLEARVDSGGQTLDSNPVSLSIF